MTSKLNLDPVVVAKARELARRAGMDGQRLGRGSQFLERIRDRMAP